jgi:ABC-type microcin C transport system duplicated ATPase subunit YejF
LIDINQSEPVSFGRKTVISDFSLKINVGERIAIVGESGSGKTLTGLSIMGLLPEGANITGEINCQINQKTQNLLALSEAHMRNIRGKRHCHDFSRAYDCFESTLHGRQSDHGSSAVP